jgi:hypothetical protein
MGDVRLDADAVRAVARRVLDGADALGETPWPTTASVAPAGSAVERAVATAGLEHRIADLVADLRAWAASAQSATAAVEDADARDAARLGAIR